MTDTVAPVAALASLQDQANELFTTFRRAAARRAAGMTLLGVGLDGIAAGIERLEPRIRCSTWNMQRVVDFEGHGRYRHLDRRSAARGVEFRMIVSSAEVAHQPILTSIYPYLHCGPVFGPTYILDRQAVLMAGPLHEDRHYTCWIGTDPELVASTLALWSRTWSVSTPLLAPGTRPPLNERQVEAAHLLCQGLSDSLIARRLGVSLRTVASDLHHAADVLGVGGRTALVAALLGATPQVR